MCYLSLTKFTIQTIRLKLKCTSTQTDEHPPAFFRFNSQKQKVQKGQRKSLSHYGFEERAEINTNASPLLLL